MKVTAISRLVSCSVAALVAVSTVMPSLVFAQPAADCQCVVPVAAGGVQAPVGQMTSVAGNVLVTGAAGPRAAEPGSTLQIGDQVTVGPQSSASLSVSGCDLQLAAQSEANLIMSDGNMCVAVADTSVQATGQQAAAGAGGSNAGLALFGGLAALQLGAGLLFDRGERTPVSP